MQICQRCRRPTEQTKLLHGRRYCLACFELVYEVLSDLKVDLIRGDRSISGRRRWNAFPLTRA